MINLYTKYKHFTPYFIAVVFIALLIIPSSKTYESFMSGDNMLNISLNTDKTSIDTIVNASIIMDTQSNNVNAVGIIINYDPTILTISSVDTSSAFCTFYIDRTYDIHAGKIDLFCGKPNPGFTGENVLETIKFRTIAYGRSDITVNPKSIITKNDGLGTNILHHFGKKQISVILSE